MGVPHPSRPDPLRHRVVTIAPDGSTRSVTRRRGPNGEKWATYRDAAKTLREALGKADEGEWADPSKQAAGAYLDEWAARCRYAR